MSDGLDERMARWFERMLSTSARRSAHQCPVPDCGFLCPPSEADFVRWAVRACECPVHGAFKRQRYYCAHCAAAAWVSGLPGSHEIPLPAGWARGPGDCISCDRPDCVKALKFARVVEMGAEVEQDR